MCASNLVPKIIVFVFSFVFGLIVGVSSEGYLTPGKEHFLTDAFLREVVNRMGKDLAEVAADPYLDFSDSSPLNRHQLRSGGHASNLMSSRNDFINARATKDMDGNEERLFPLDYDSLANQDQSSSLISGPNPSIRDQEYLQHSSLWGNQYVSGGAGEGKQRLKPEGTVKNHQEIKTDSNLPAYCNPPNPCPVGYDEDQGCTSSDEFENTAAFSRRYQAAQDCMCDSEHMFDCPSQSEQQPNALSSALEDLDFNRFWLKKNDINTHHNLVAKKFYITRDEQNPFLQGERLPVAAKKGHNVVY